MSSITKAHMFAAGAHGGYRPEAQSFQALQQHIETLSLSLSKAVNDFVESKS